MNISDHEWTPWRIRSGKCVLTQDWGAPVKWNKAVDPVRCVNAVGERFSVSFRRPTVLVSLSDWLDPNVPVEQLTLFLDLIQSTPHLNWLLLTKRPELWLTRMRAAALIDKIGNWAPSEIARKWFEYGQPPENVWVGALLEDQLKADKRIPELLKIPSVGRFLLVEPMLGPVDFRFVSDEFDCVHPFPSNPSGPPTGMIHWVIFGGESGPGARRCSVEWIRDGLRQCRAAGVPAFVKQVGADPTFCAPLRVQDWGQEHISEASWISALTHPNGGDPAEWPEDLRVRKFPKGLR